jgi:tetratricopeptide (TPR) repeat protein
VFAQAVGDKLVVTGAEAQLQQADNRREAVAKGTILTVNDLEGGHYRVSYTTPRKNIEGLIRKSDVLPLKDALDFFSDEAKRDASAKTDVILGLLRVAHGQPQRALVAFDEAIRKNPTFAQAHYCRAGVLLDRGEYQTAIAAYDEVIRLEPTNAAAFYGRGAAWDYIGENEKALADMDRALGLDPKLYVAYCVRGTIWLTQGMYDRAIREYSEALRVKPTAVDAIVGRAGAWMKIRQYDKAIGDYDQAIRIDGNDATSHLYRGMAWRAKGRYDKAIADLSTALRLEKDFREARWELANIFATSPDPKYRNGPKALEIMGRKVDDAVWNAYEGFDTLAAAYAEARDFESAVRWQEKAVASCPKESKADYRSRLTLYHDGKPYRRQEQMEP